MTNEPYEGTCILPGTIEDFEPPAKKIPPFECSPPCGDSRQYVAAAEIFGKCPVLTQILRQDAPEEMYRPAMAPAA